jgi:hypothetical protein
MDHLLVQTREIVTGSREGGFFIMIGRKPALPESHLRNGGPEVNRQSAAPSREYAVSEY